MAFGARNDEGWRLCHRKGKTIFFVVERHFPDIPVEFPSQARAKACADDLNLLWDAYWKKEKKGEPPEPHVFWEYLDLLVKHNGISADDLKEIRNHAS